MRLLFATTRGAGHVGPLVPFARAAVAAGHDVAQDLFVGLHARLALPAMLELVETWRPDVVVRESRASTGARPRRSRRCRCARC
jgi:hypothetical protein